MGSVRIGGGALVFQLVIAFGAAPSVVEPPPAAVEPPADTPPRDVVTREDYLEVVRDERAHEAIRVANLVLRLLLEGGLHRLLFITVRLRASMIPCRIHLACVLVDTDIGGVLLAQLATDRNYQMARNNSCHNN